ncbi:hypothetical protein [Cupriavidus agavae]|uniref:Uncharacterized protein n=1 Tax=Cupriavidus agavae TaxID=1001822 RepID=A0A4Q7S8J9_9BURK|nr:hypothetical protein [Cupriavidus agavae]RZT42791.1 hypothetical protein EV147_1835 [Cupriavidus agavae]
MKSFLAATLLTCGAAYANDDSAISAQNALHDYCGYSLGPKLLAATIATNHRFTEGIAVIALDIALPNKSKSRRKIGNLSFVCRTEQTSPEDTYSADVKERHAAGTTAREEIDDEDLRGRYGRIVAWQREYQGDNFKGTIAYTDYIFGDGYRFMHEPQFYVCPTRPGISCFSLTVQNDERLTKSEIAATAHLLRDISLVQPEPIAQPCPST